MSFTLRYSFWHRFNAYLNQLNIQPKETDSKYFTVFTLLFAALSGIALNYQQYATSAVLYLLAITIDFLDKSVGRLTGRLNIGPITDETMN